MSTRGLLADPIPNSPSLNNENCITNSRENYQINEVLEGVKRFRKNCFCFSFLSVKHLWSKQRSVDFLNFSLQVTVIKNLAQEEGKDTKAFLKQQPFAKPGNKKYFLL